MEHNADMQTNNAISEILTVPQLCEILHIGKHTAYSLLRSGQLCSRKIGRSYRIRKKDVMELFRESR